MVFPQNLSLRQGAGLIPKRRRAGPLECARTLKKPSPKKTLSETCGTSLAVEKLSRSRGVLSCLRASEIYLLVAFCKLVDLADRARRQKGN